MSKVKKIKTKKTWQGVLGLIILLLGILFMASMIVEPLAEIASELLGETHSLLGGLAYFLILIGILLLVWGSKVKVRGINSDGEVVLYRKKDGLLKCAIGYDETNEKANEKLTPYEVLNDPNNTAPIKYKSEDGDIMYFEQLYVHACWSNNVVRLYAVVNPVGDDDNLIVCFAVESNKKELYVENNDGIENLITGLMKTALEKEKSKRKGKEEAKGALKDLGGIFGNVFGGAFGGQSSSGAQYSVYENGSERTLTKLDGIHYDGTKEVDKFVDDVGSYWYSDDGGNTFYRA